RRPRRQAQAGRAAGTCSDSRRVRAAARRGVRRAVRALAVRGPLGALAAGRDAARRRALAPRVPGPRSGAERRARPPRAAPPGLRRAARRGARPVKLSWTPVRVRLRAPLFTAHGELRDREGFLVRVDEGRGEACPLPWFGTEDVAACARALSSAAEALL